MYLVNTDKLRVSFGVGKNKNLQAGGDFINYSLTPRLRIRKRSTFIFNLTIGFCFYKWYGYFQFMVKRKYNRKPISTEELAQLIKNRNATKPTNTQKVV